MRSGEVVICDFRLTIIHCQPTIAVAKTMLLATAIFLCPYARLSTNGYYAKHRNFYFEKQKNDVPLQFKCSNYTKGVKQQQKTIIKSINPYYGSK